MRRSVRAKRAKESPFFLIFAEYPFFGIVEELWKNCWKNCWKNFGRKPNIKTDIN